MLKSLVSLLIFIMIFNQFALDTFCYCSPLGVDGVATSGGGGGAGAGGAGAGGGGGSGSEHLESTNDTPMKVAEAGIKQRHRHAFNLRMFPALFHAPNNPTMKELKDHPNTSHLSKEMSQGEWEEAIHIVQNFGPAKESDATEAQKDFRKSLEKSKAKKWSKLVDKYKVEVYTLPGSDQPRKRLMRLHKPSGFDEERWLLCIPQLQVFDAIYENHHLVSHLKMNQTCVKVQEKYYNVTEKQVNEFVATCETCNHANPIVKKQKGAKKPILSENFRDRFQVDLIDMRASEMKDVYGNTMRWILTLKDHSTQLTYLQALPRKFARYVAHELDRIFGLIGYPSIFHTDNGKEFTANEILVLLKEYSESIITVTGRPRTPSDQGSVESMNKLVHKIIKDLENEARLRGKEPNWTKLLGRAMQTINSKCGRGKHDCEPYQAVFGQHYNQDISCSVNDMRQCSTINERLKLSDDGRLREVASELCVLGGDETFQPPEISYWEDDDVDMQRKSDSPSNDVDMQETSNHPPTQDTSNLPPSQDMSNLPRTCPRMPVSEVDARPSNSNETLVRQSLPPPNDKTGSAPPDHQKLVGENLAIASAPPSNNIEDRRSVSNSNIENDIEAEAVTTTVENSALPMRHNRQKYTVSQARKETKSKTRSLKTPHLRTRRGGFTQYEFIYPTLECECCFLGTSLISVGDEKYMEDCGQTNRWYESDFLSSFGALAAHRRHSLGSDPISIQFITCNYPNEAVIESQCRELALTTTRVVSAFHASSHFVVAEMDLSSNLCTISDGLKMPLYTWKKHIINVLQRCKRMDLGSTYFFDESDNTLEFQWVFTTEKWTIRHDPSFVQQKDGFNCGPLACMKMEEIFLDETIFDGIDCYRGFVTDRFAGMVRLYDAELCVSVSTRRSTNRTTASNDISIDCWCLEDTAPSELTIKLPCCRKHQHAKCAFEWFDISGTCGLCRKEVKEIEFQRCKIPVVEILNSNATGKIDSHFKTAPSLKPFRNPSEPLSTASDEDSTPLRDADRMRKMCSKSKRKCQEHQAEKMIKLRKKQDTGVGIGAIVTIALDKRDFTMASGVRAVVYDVKEETGGILACCEYGVIVHDNADYWIPSDRYGVTASPDDTAVLTDGLMSIREEVLGKSFDPSAKERVTLSKAMKDFTGRSPRKRAACKCRGRCSNSCGCRRRNVVCSSSCGCGGNCRNPV